MADNVTANAGSGGATFATISTSFSGDTANFAGSFIVLATGSEGSWTVTQLAGGAGSVSAGVPRVTLASDDPGVTHLSSIATSLAILDDWDSSDACKIVGTGTAGTANAGVVTVQGIASMTPVQVSQATASNLNATVVGTGTFVVQATCTNGGTFVVQENGAALTALQLIDDVIATLGTTTYSEASTKGAIIGAVRRDADTTLVDTTNEIGPLQMNAAGQLKVEVFSGETLPVSLTSTTITGTVAVTQSGTWDEVGIHDSGNSITVDNGGTFAVQVSSLPASTNTIEVVGDGAHDSAIAGNPVRVGGRALSSNYTAVTAGDTADIVTTLLGKLLTIPYALPGTTWNYATANGGVTDTADDEAKAAGGSGVRQYVTRVQVINGHGSTSTEVVIKTGSTVMWRGWAQAAGGGAAATFDPPLRGGDNEAINVTNITNSSQTYFNLQGYTAAE